MRQVEWELERERNRERVSEREGCLLHHISFSSPEGALLVNVASLLRKNNKKIKIKRSRRSSKRAERPKTENKHQLTRESEEWGEKREGETGARAH